MSFGVTMGAAAGAGVGPGLANARTQSSIATVTLAGREYFIDPFLGLLIHCDVEQLLQILAACGQKQSIDPPAAPL